MNSKYITFILSLCTIALHMPHLVGCEHKKKCTKKPNLYKKCYFSRDPHERTACRNILSLLTTEKKCKVPLQDDEVRKEVFINRITDYLTQIYPDDTKMQKTAKQAILTDVRQWDKGKLENYGL